MADKALVMLSGGLDSATCLYWAKEKFSSVSAITFNYFGRLVKEKRAAAKLAKGAGVAELIQVDLPFVKEASDFYNGRLKKQEPDVLLDSRPLCRVPWRAVDHWRAQPARRQVLQGRLQRLH